MKVVNVMGGQKSCQTKQKRDSNVELLRIFSMFLVLVIHYIPSRGIPSPTSISHDLIGSLFNLELRSICFVCVNCFILISGYYGIRWKIKSFCNLLFQIMFWYLVSILVVMGIKADWSLGYVAEVFRHDCAGRWFVESYIGLYLIAPVLNLFIKHTDIKNFIKVLVAFYLFSTLWGWIGKSPDINEGMSVISLVGLYLIGAFIRKANLKWLQWDKAVYLWSYLGIGLLLMLLSAVALKLGITKSLYGYLNPLIILESVCLFLFFLKFKIGHIQWINWTSASAFSVYLCHTGGAVSPYYQEACRYIEANYSYSFFVAIAFLIILFLSIVLVDKFTRVVLWNKIIRGIGKENNSLV